MLQRFRDKSTHDPRIFRIFSTTKRRRGVCLRRSGRDNGRREHVQISRGGEPTSPLRALDNRHVFAWRVRGEKRARVQSVSKHLTSLIAAPSPSFKIHALPHRINERSEFTLGRRAALKLLICYVIEAVGGCEGRSTCREDGFFLMADRSLRVCRWWLKLQSVQWVMNEFMLVGSIPEERSVQYFKCIRKKLPLSDFSIVLWTTYSLFTYFFFLSSFILLRYHSSTLSAPSVCTTWLFSV